MPRVTRQAEPVAVNQLTTQPERVGRRGRLSFESDRGEIACKEDICRTIGHEGSGWQPRARQ